MRSQGSNNTAGQSSGSSDQKKSVFERLGHQLESAARSMKQRPSPGPIFHSGGGGTTDYMPPPTPVHEADFIGYPRELLPHPQVELALEWRYHQSERLQHAANQFSGRERGHPQAMQGPPPHHYAEMEMAGRQPPGFYPPPHSYHHSPSPGPPPGPPIGGPGGNLPSMSMLPQQRSSPKYDRHGNIVGYNDRGGGHMRSGGHMEHHPGMSPPPSRAFLPAPGPPMLHPGMDVPPHEIPPHEIPPHDMPPRDMPPHDMPPPDMSPYDMPPLRSDEPMYPIHGRWLEGMEHNDFLPHSRMLPDGGRFSPVSARRFQQQILNQQQQAPPPPGMGRPVGPLLEGPPRYTKWRERRDVITTLDRETAQSSSRTDSLKSSLQQTDPRLLNNAIVSDDFGVVGGRCRAAVAKKFLSAKQAPVEAPVQHPVINPATEENDSSSTSSSSKEATVVSKPTVSGKEQTAVKTEPQEISDGEIVDDEDSSDDSEAIRMLPIHRIRREATSNHHLAMNENYLSNRAASGHVGLPEGSYGPSSRVSLASDAAPHGYYDNPSHKKRRLHEREDYSMDYETISDEDLDDFMDDKKISDALVAEEAKLANERLCGEDGKSISEIELLNALGLDWANLVEMAKQSKASSKDTYTPGSALPRFSLPNYLPTLGITVDLAGPELYELMLRICRSSG